MAGADYVGTSGTVTFGPGEEIKSVLISTLGEARLDTSFTVQFRGSGVTFFGKSGGYGDIPTDCDLLGTSL